METWRWRTGVCFRFMCRELGESFLLSLPYDLVRRSVLSGSCTVAGRRQY